LRAAAALLGLLVTGAGCGGAPPIPTSTPPPPAPYQVNVALDAATHYQVMQGFGGAIAFYVNWVSRHPNAAQIYQAAFVDLGIQMLRIGNWVGNQGDNGGSAINDTITVVQGATAALGHPPLIELSSWSPPASLKNNGHVQGGGSLGPATPGGDKYADFAQWWTSSLAQHEAAGVIPDYVSIQNEPDFVASGWQSCLFDPTEGTNAGYDKALDAVYKAFSAAAVAGTMPMPKLLGPEVSGIANNRVQGYVDALAASQQLGEIDGVAHHLYNGGTATSPTSFDTTMSQLTGLPGDKPLFMTEYGPTSPEMFSTASLIYEAVTVEGVSAYLFWPLTWAPPAAGAVPTGLVTTENPMAPSTWKSTNGFIINDIYYAVRHFSKWIDVGWIRAAATSDVGVVKATAFVSPDGTQATIVLLNTDSAEHAVTLDPGTFAFTTSAVYRTSGTSERTAALGPLPSPLVMPGASIATVTLAP
jgi:glucuronoarabinoxylan endo-1,4-beta-xylanase